MFDKHIIHPYFFFFLDKGVWRENLGEESLPN